MPSVREEISAFNSLDFLGPRADNYRISTYLNEKFNEGTLIAALNSPRNILHIASHFKRGNSYGDSGLLLLGDGRTLSGSKMWRDFPEMRGLGLVTLSACETANTLLPSGRDGIDGLANIFLQKGASNVVATLWSISDRATADFMAIFYLLYAELGQSAPVALKNTQEAFASGRLPLPLSNRKLPTNIDVRLLSYRHPFYWAPYVVVTPSTLQ